MAPPFNILGTFSSFHASSCALSPLQPQPSNHVHVRCNTCSLAVHHTRRGPNLNYLSVFPLTYFVEGEKKTALFRFVCMNPTCQLLVRGPTTKRDVHKDFTPPGCCRFRNTIPFPPANRNHDRIRPTP
jgi:hypothetical protein